MPSLADFQYDLPPDRIAQAPADRREDARLLVVDRAQARFHHHVVRDLPDLLQAGDLLVVNDTRVVRARVHAHKQTGGLVELLFHGSPTRHEGPGWVCRALTRASKPLAPGMPLQPVGGGPAVHVAAVLPQGEAMVAGPAGSDFYAWLEAVGEVPLPPYIRRDAAHPADDAADAARYQTTFAREPGAVAAPTAGLHFTPALFAALAARGVGRAELTLHVGPGTFMPVREDDYARHELLPETYALSADTAAAVAAHRPPRGRVVAVGTTVVRTLEGAAADDGTVRPGRGETRLFITPGHRFAVVDALITNFHLPGSTLLLLVAAFAGRDLVLSAYAAAIREGYRFYSYGDAMLIV